MQELVNEQTDYHCFASIHQLPLFWCGYGSFRTCNRKGGGAYANGSEDFMSGAFPPPGTYIVNFFNYYHAGKLKDNKGNTSPVDFDLEAIADTVRFVHITKQKVFGADWGMQMLTPFVKVHVSTPVGSIQKQESVILSSTLFFSDGILPIGILRQALIR